MAPCLNSYVQFHSLTPCRNSSFRSSSSLEPGYCRAMLWWNALLQRRAAVKQCCGTSCCVCGSSERHAAGPSGTLQVLEARVPPISPPTDSHSGAFPGCGWHEHWTSCAAAAAAAASAATSTTTAAANGALY